MMMMMMMMMSYFSIKITTASLLNMHRAAFSVSCAVRCCLHARQSTKYSLSLSLSLSLCWNLIDRAPHTSSGERVEVTTDEHEDL